ncbi:MAG: IS200/IS605 family element transposase accessory protein TnpB [Erysipelotrichaceae bacterium]|nr:IS200/IS605 family element transposase accessory protein TnpB [Erysipelotrichaceae bacterium]
MENEQILKTVKFRMYPDRKQEKLLNSTFGCCRLIFNMGLDMRIKAFKNNVKCGYMETSKMLTKLKENEDFRFLKDVDSVALQQTLRDLDCAYRNFFSKHAGFPKFKSKKNPKASYRTINQNNKIRIEGNKIRLPKLGYVKIKKSLEPGKIHSATIEKASTGKYFVSVLYETFRQKHINGGGEVGVDVGINNFCVLSDGTKIENPKFLKKLRKRLIRQQRKLSRKKIDSNNFYKQKKELALIHEKICNQRNDFLHKLSNSLVSENQTISLENLEIRNMLRNHHLAESISDVSWYKFKTLLKYKAELYGTKIVEIDTFFPSSQMCSVCGYRNPNVKDLRVRFWTCPQCQTRLDRDINAAINIKNEGFRLVFA